ncbi:uncharacterized protein K444DRAFT_613375 [Hyaloscypha bicolor E]|uniref:Uncharacterized protein n=1 Tax=Hyaloscypha bicolor E TaxID=1095630 RepID=A0A2J6T8P3_9HELO|nr:uncharacterized protein K444DRAFT_613375 [Hyaloscypha bicolor E]PMD59399.1 hypothetical protein K444DRAFT_613375 [Hyaloscypha bicolor E]
MYLKLQKVWKELMRDKSKGRGRYPQRFASRRPRGSKESIGNSSGRNIKIHISRQKPCLKNWVSRTELTYKKEYKNGTKWDT